MEMLDFIAVRIFGHRSQHDVVMLRAGVLESTCLSKCSAHCFASTEKPAEAHKKDREKKCCEEVLK